MNTKKMEVFLALAIAANHIEETFTGEKRCIHCLGKMSKSRSVPHTKTCPVHVSLRVLKKMNHPQRFQVDGGRR